MSVIAEFTVQSDDFALDHTLTTVPDALVEIERIVATMKDRVMPYFWVTSVDQAAFQDVFEEDESVQEIRRVDEVDGAALYRATWTKNIETIVYAYVEVGATILEATGSSGQWELQMRFDDSETLSDFQTYCQENDVSFELHGLREQSEPMASTQYHLTPKQRDTLVTALDAGYFDVPQKITMADLADQLGITQQALSKRLHHAYKNLIDSTLTVGRNDPSDDSS